jgi:hypothetical protein
VVHGRPARLAGERPAGMVGSRAVRTAVNGGSKPLIFVLRVAHTGKGGARPRLRLGFTAHRGAASEWQSRRCLEPRLPRCSIRYGRTKKTPCALPGWAGPHLIRVAKPRVPRRVVESTPGLRHDPFVRIYTSVGDNRRPAHQLHDIPRKACAGAVGVRQISSRFVSHEERIEIADLRHAGWGIRQIAQRLGRAPSTVSPELRRNAASDDGPAPKRLLRRGRRPAMCPCRAGCPGDSQAWRRTWTRASPQR